MKITFLGTSSVFPTKKRNHSCVALDMGPETILFDCGEGTQRQIRIAGLAPMKISKILITHWHGDHVLGIPGLLESFHMSNRTKALDIFGPKGTKKYIKHMLSAFEIKIKYKLNIHEIDVRKPKKIFETNKYELWAAKMQHVVTCIGWSWIQKDKIKINTSYLKKFGLKAPHPILKKLQQGKNITWKGKKIKFEKATFTKPGKKITYVVDALATDQVAEFAKDSDIFICEATFSQEYKEAAAERGHMTAKQAGKLAKKAKVKQLIITHFSQRFRNVKPLLKEAKGVFKNTKAAKDFLEIKI
ncbi:ribonuclease Z [Candidatus Woesearchaeota archaeon]|nr:ribonuclease Z [Candidatus Woesearchaeota archaeon]